MRRTTLAKLNEELMEEGRRISLEAGYEERVIAMQARNEGGGRIRISTILRDREGGEGDILERYRDVLVACRKLVDEIEREVRIEDDEANVWRERIADDAFTRVAGDETGIAELAGIAKKALEELLAGCSVEQGDADEYTRVLVQYYIEFYPKLKGGSKADWCGRRCVEALDGYTLSEADRDLVEKLYGWVNKQALYPQRENDVLEKAGITL